jgi:uncharacterized protein YjdB
LAFTGQNFAVGLAFLNLKREKNMKNVYFQILIALLLTGALFTGCKKDKDPTDQDKVLVISNGAQSIKPDGSLTYSAKFVSADGTVSPANGVSWSTSEASVATVSASGVVAVAGVGTVTVTATVTEDGQTYTASVPLGIAAPTVFAVVPSAIIWEASGSIQLETFYLGTATPTYTFSSSNTAVASVSSTGNVSFNGIGSCTITVTASTHPNNPFIVPVMVVGIPTVTLPVTRVEVTPASASLFRQETQQLSAQAFNPDGAVSKTFTWTSSDPAIASVDASGRVTARALGNAYIYAMADGITGQAEIYVSPDTIIEVTPFIAGIRAGANQQFTAKAYNVRTGALLPGITQFDWFIPSYGIPMFDFATVNASGLVSVNSNAMPGNMTFVAATMQGNQEVGGVAVIMVSLCDCGTGNPAVASINISGALNLSLLGSPTGQINATALDFNGAVVANPDLRYCVDDMAVATVDDMTGQVFATGPGTTTVRACSGGYAEATTTVTVGF